MVPPGRYQAVLTAGTQSQTAQFEVKMDPRVLKEGVTAADVTAQAELALKVRDALSRARIVAARIERAQKETASEPEAVRKIEAIKREVTTAPIRYSRPMLVDQLEYLYSNLNRADQRPGGDAIARYEELNKTLDGHVRALEQVFSAKTKTQEGRD